MTVQENTDITKSDISEESQEIVWEIWDNNSDINGLSADKVREIFNITKEDISYLIRDINTGQVQVFQPFEPNVSGYKKMDRASAEEKAKQTKANIVATQNSTKEEII